MNSNKQDDALVLVHLRNQFYKRKFYFALSTFVLSLIIIGFLLGVIYYLEKHPARPFYFVTDQVSRLLKDIPRTQANFSTEEVAKWATEAVETAYSYDFVNFRRQLQDAQKYFSDYGWQEYMRGLTKSNNLLALTERKMLFIAKVVAQPKLTASGILGGAYGWKFEMPLLVTYYTPPYDDKHSFSNPLLVTVVVQRQSILTSYRGLSVVQMIGNLIINPNPTPMTPPP